MCIVPVYKGIYKDIAKDFVGFVMKRKICQKESTDTVANNQGKYDDNEFEDSQLVFGWANVTLNEDGTIPADVQGDSMETEELEAAAYSYVLNKGLANQEHEYGTDCGYLIESIMFTKEKMAALNIPEGLIPEGWFVGFYIPDKTVYNKVKNGEYNMFSIEGRARRIDISGQDVCNSGLY